MTKRASRRLQVAPQESDLEVASSVDSLLDVILPFAPSLLRTIGLAGSAEKVEGGDDKPGNVQAAAIGIDFIMKALSGRAGDRAAAVMREIRKLREASLGKTQTGD